MLNSEQNAVVCDATDDDSSTKAGLHSHNPSINSGSINAEKQN